MDQFGGHRFGRWLACFDDVLKVGSITILMLIMLGGILALPFLVILSLLTPLAIFTVPYFGWMYYDRATPCQGSRRRQWFRQLKIWRYCAEYFPLRIHKTGHLDPNKNYILGYHPHGIMALGAFVSASHDGGLLSELFPGITFYGANLSWLYYLPLMREFALLYGALSVDRASIEYMLTQKGKGIVVLISIGGLRESYDTCPNRMDLTLRSRQGFVKVAFKTGASLIPSICFGENELFTDVPLSESSLTYKMLNQFDGPKRRGVCYGRGWFSWMKGPLPHRKPLNFVLGKPIDVQKRDNPSQEEIDALHQAYMDALVQLFDENKLKYAEDPNMQIVLK